MSFSTLITGDNFLNVLEVKWHEMEFELASHSPADLWHLTRIFLKCADFPMPKANARCFF